MSTKDLPKLPDDPKPPSWKPDDPKPPVGGWKPDAGKPTPGRDALSQSPCCHAVFIAPQPDAPEYLPNVVTCPDCGRQYTPEQLKAEYEAQAEAAKAAKKPLADS